MRRGRGDEHNKSGLSGLLSSTASPLRYMYVTNIHLSITDHPDGTTLQFLIIVIYGARIGHSGWSGGHLRVTDRPSHCTRPPVAARI